MIKLYVNRQLVNNLEDLRNSLDWTNQRGEYAKIEYVFSSSEDKNIIIEKLPYISIVTTIYDHSVEGKASYTMRNWYNECSECTIPDKDRTDRRYYSKELSFIFNFEKIRSIIKEDNLVELE